jgi:hypothetical protein
MGVKNSKSWPSPPTETSFTVSFKGLTNSDERMDKVSHCGQWSVTLYPNGIDNTCRNHISCYLVNQSAHVMIACYTLSLLNEQGVALATRTSHTTQFASGTMCSVPGHCSWGFNTFYSYLPAHRPAAATVKASVCVYDPVNPSSSLRCDAPVFESTELTKLLVAGQLSDFTILAPASARPSQSAAPNTSLPPGRAAAVSSTAHAPAAASVRAEEDWEGIPVHRLVLSLRSPVLAAMAQSGMLESAQGQLRIPDFNAAVVREFVRYLYTDACDVTPHAEALLAVSHRYDVPALQYYCEKQLVAGLDASNAPEVLHLLSLADLYAAPDLKAGVLKHIAEHAPALLRTGALLPNLSAEHCQAVLCAVAGVRLSDAAPGHTEASGTVEK